MILETRAVPEFYKNGYLLGCEDTREAVVIDPGDEIGELVDLARARDLRVVAILLTHGHVDHVSGVAEAKRVFDVPVYLDRGDLFLYRGAARQAEFFGFTIGALPPIDRFYEPGEGVRFGRYEAVPHTTPGHSPGGICLAVRRVPPEGIEPGGQAGRIDGLFVGDTLFAGSIGRTDLPGGDYATLLRSIRDVLFAFGDAAPVFPGHGTPTTIGEERRTNPFLA